MNRQDAKTPRTKDFNKPVTGHRSLVTHFGKR